MPVWELSTAEEMVEGIRRAWPWVDEAEMRELAERYANEPDFVVVGALTAWCAWRAAALREEFPGVGKLPENNVVVVESG